MVHSLYVRLSVSWLGSSLPFVKVYISTRALSNEKMIILNNDIILFSNSICF